MKTILFAMTAVLVLASAPAVARADGAEMYEKKCARCHGMDGKAETTMGRRLNMRDLTNPKVQEGSTDEQWGRLIREGVRGAGGKNVMPVTQASPDEVKDLLKYLRSFKK